MRITHGRNIFLRKVRNMRDLGGIKTSDGKTIRSGKLVRCGKLYNLPESTVKRLQTMGVTTIADFRVFAEYEAHPDTQIEGVRHVSLPVLCTPGERIDCERNMRLTMKRESYRLKEEISDMDEYMVQTYRSIVFSEQPQKSLATFLRLVVDEEGCILWHCTSGKDRSGICAMLVEALLGVDEATILEDYFLSRRMLRNRFTVQKAGIVILPVSVRFKRMLFGYMNVKKEYLKAIIDDMKTRYGGIIAYCKSVLGITDDDISVMRNKYLV